MVCNACIAKLNSLGIRHQMKVSPTTGKLTPMIQGRTILSTSPFTSPGDYIGNFKGQLTSAMITQTGVDSYCDAVDFYGTDLETTFTPSFWAAVGVSASGELGVLGPDGNLIMGWDDFALAVIMIVTSTPFLIGVFLLVPAFFILEAIFGYLNGSANYITYTDVNGNTQHGPPSAFLASQEQKYWYVCQNTGYGVGLRSQYATASDVPKTDVDIFNDICNNSTNIFPNWTSGLLMQIVYASVIIGGVYIAIKILPTLFSSRGKQQ